MIFKSKSIIFYLIVILMVALDQVTKAIARSSLGGGEKITVIPGFFDLILSFNQGAAFGILPNWAPLFIIVTLVAIYTIVRLRRAESESKTLTVGLALLLGGALGNLVDRLTSPVRAVTDFLSFHITAGGNAHEWPTFNLADAAIVVGAILLFVHVYAIERRRA